MPTFDKFDPSDDFSDLLIDPARWPRPTDDLRVVGNDHRFIAYPGYRSLRDPWSDYIEGYRLGAQAIFDRIKDPNDETDKNLLIFPFLMTWRQCIELQLKALCAVIQSRDSRESRPLLSHKLDVLWRHTRALIESSPCGQPEELPDVERVILQLNMIDPNSEHARYPVTANGALTLSDLKYLDMYPFHDALDGVANFFDGLSDYLHEAYRLEAEIAAEYYNDAYTDSYW